MSIGHSGTGNEQDSRKGKGQLAVLLPRDICHGEVVIPARVPSARNNLDLNQSSIGISLGVGISFGAVLVRRFLASGNEPFGEIGAVLRSLEGRVVANVMTVCKACRRSHDEERECCQQQHSRNNKGRKRGGCRASHGLSVKGALVDSTQTQAPRCKGKGGQKEGPGAE